MTTVIKLGGSLSNDPRLRSCLSSIADFGDVIVVPGGGPYANAVRAQQARWKFPDEQAHHMAVLAMDQFALQLYGIEPRLTLVNSNNEIHLARTEQRSVIWLPSEMVLSDASIANSWDITSDSLAAWLARMICAKQLILVKSCTIPSSATTADLIDSGVLDRGFAQMSLHSAQRIRVISIGNFAQLVHDIRSSAPKIF